MKIIVGTVSSTDSSDRTVKVAFPDKDKTVSAPLQIVYPVGSESEKLPEVDDIVLCLYCDTGAGYVIGEIRSE